MNISTAANNNTMNMSQVVPDGTGTPGGECNIKVVCRFRPLNESEEKAGSKFVVKFSERSEEGLCSIGVCVDFSVLWT